MCGPGSAPSGRQARAYLHDLHRAVEVDASSDATDQLQPQDDNNTQLHRPSEGTHSANDSIADEPDDASECPGPLRGGPVPLVPPLLKLTDNEGLVSAPLGDNQGDVDEHHD